MPQYVLLAVEVLTHCDEEYIAHTIVMDIIRLAESDNQTPLLAQAYGMQGLIYALSNKTMQADTSSIELFSKAQKLATEMKSYAALPWIALHQMEYYQQINDSESSQRYYQQALQLFTQYGMEEWRHYFLTSKGIKPTIQVSLKQLNLC